MFKTQKTIILKKFTNDCDEHGQFLWRMLSLLLFDILEMNNWSKT